MANTISEIKFSTDITEFLSPYSKEDLFKNHH